MATQTIARGEKRKAGQVPVRHITHEDLSLSLRQGLDDFLTFRGDIVFAGLIYTLIGIAAVVMTASAPLMPFSFRWSRGSACSVPSPRPASMSWRAAAKRVSKTFTGIISSMS